MRKLPITREHQDAIRDRLQLLTDRNGGILLARHVVEDAKDPESPLHSEFEWDLKKAADAHWLARAGEIIRTIVITHRTTHTVLKTPYYIRNPNAAGSEPGYVTITKLRTEEDSAREAVVNEFAQAAHVLRRARNLAKALGMESDVEALLNGVVGLRDRLLHPGDLRRPITGMDAGAAQ